MGASGFCARFSQSGSSKTWLPLRGLGGFFSEAAHMPFYSHMPNFSSLSLFHFTVSEHRAAKTARQKLLEEN